MPVKVYSRAQQKVVEVPASEAQRGVLKGEYSIPEGQTVTIAKGNKIGKGPGSALLTELGRGARLVDEDEAERIRIKREESDIASQALATGESAAAGLSLGLTTALEEAAGADVDRMRARREAADWVGTAAEVGGALIGGGTGLAAKGGVAAARGGAAGLLSRGARGLERGVAKSLPAATPKAARHILPGAVGQTAEGLGYAAGAELDDAVLGERPIVSEHILAGGLLSGAIRGTLGLAAPGINKVVEGTGRLPAQAARRLSGTVDGLAAKAEAAAEALPQSFPEMVDTVARKSAKATGGDEAKFLELAGYAHTPEKTARAFKILHDPDGAVEEISGEVMGAVSAVRDSLDEVVPAISRGNKPKHVDRYLPDDGPEAHWTRVKLAQDEINALENRVAGMSADNAQAGHTLYNQGDLNKLAALAKKARFEISEHVPQQHGQVMPVAKGNPREAAIASYHAIDRLKQQIDEFAQSRNTFSKLDAQVADTYSALSSTNGRIRKFLENEDVWAAAGARQKKLNAAASGALGARRELGTRGSVLGRLMDRSKTADPSDALALTKSYGKMRGTERMVKLDDYLDAELHYLRTARELSDLDPATAAMIDRAEVAIDSMRKGLTKRAEDARLTDLAHYVRALESSGSPSMGLYSTVGPKVAAGLGRAAAAGAGAVVGGIPGAIVGSAVGEVAGTLAGSITRPYTAFKTLVSLSHKANQSGRSFDGMVGRMLGKMRGAGKTAARAKGGLSKAADSIDRGAAWAGRAAEKATKATGRAAGLAAVQTQSERREEAERTRQRVLTLRGQRGKLAEELANPLRLIGDHAPLLYDTIVGGAQRAADFLSTKVPARYESPYGNGKPIRNTVEEARWERYIDIAFRPDRAFELLELGQLTSEHVEALREIYPERYASLVDSVWSEIAAARAEGRTVPFKERARLAVLLDVPTDQVFLPENLAAVQAVWQSNAQAPMGKGPGRPKKASNVADSTLTPAQKTEV